MFKYKHGELNKVTNDGKKKIFYIEIETDDEEVQGHILMLCDRFYQENWRREFGEG